MLYRKFRNNRVKKGEERMNISSRKGFGINEVIGIAAGVIIAAVIVIPGLRTFALSVMGGLAEWWRTISVNIFSS